MGESWFSEVKKEAIEIGIELLEGEVKGKMESVWKKEAKTKIKEQVKKKY